MSELERMTQYKDKARKQQENISVGFTRMIIGPIIDFVFYLLFLGVR